MELTEEQRRKVNRTVLRREVGALFDFLMDLIDHDYVLLHPAGVKRIATFKWGEHRWRLTIEPEVSE